MDANDCESCMILKDLCSKHKETIKHIQIKMRDLIQAYQLKERELQERDLLLKANLSEPLDLDKVCLRMSCA